MTCQEVQGILGLIALWDMGRGEIGLWGYDINVIRPMNLIAEYVDYSLYPNRIWLKPDWASVVFEDDWGDGKCPRHLERGKLETLIKIVRELGETHVTYSDPNCLELLQELDLNQLD